MNGQSKGCAGELHDDWAQRRRGSGGESASKETWAEVPNGLLTEILGFMTI